MTSSPRPPDPETFDQSLVDALAQPPDDPWAARAVGCLFIVTALSGLAFAAALMLNLPTPVQGVLAFTTAGALGVGLVLWAHRLLPLQQYVEQRRPLASEPDESRLLAQMLMAERGLTRRSVLRWLLLAALGGATTAFLAPVLSLGRAPSSRLYQTPWRTGLRLVDGNDQPVSATALPLGGVLTVFPEGDPTSALGQALLIRVDPAQLRLSPERAGWAPNGFIAFSKVCTHAGCPVGVYRATTHELICPCHQSTFDVLEGATPVFGPAVRALPQLPIQLMADGTFVALDGFGEPVGPSFWNMPRDGLANG